AFRPNYASCPRAATWSKRSTTTRPRCHLTKKQASRRRLNRTARAVSSTPSARARSSTQPSGVEGYLHRRLIELLHQQAPAPNRLEQLQQLARSRRSGGIDGRPCSE